MHRNEELFLVFADRRNAEIGSNLNFAFSLSLICSLVHQMLNTTLAIDYSFKF